MSAEYFIYARVSKGRIGYVGQTRCPHTRYRGGIICLLRAVSDRANALRLESQIIRALKRRGQCAENFNLQRLGRMWRVTFTVPKNWKKPVKSKLALMGISIKDYMTTQVEKLSS